jgi:hypothetical protein
MHVDNYDLWQAQIGQRQLKQAELYSVIDEVLKARRDASVMRAPVPRDRRAERWREVSRCLRLALQEAVQQLKAAGITPSKRIKDALLLSAVAPLMPASYPIKSQPLHTCTFEAYSDGYFCPVCFQPKL